MEQVVSSRSVRDGFLEIDHLTMGRMVSLFLAVAVRVPLETDTKLELEGNAWEELR